MVFCRDISLVVRCLGVGRWGKDNKGVGVSPSRGQQLSQVMATLWLAPLKQKLQPGLEGDFPMKDSLNWYVPTKGFDFSVSAFSDEKPAHRKIPDEQRETPRRIGEGSCPMRKKFNTGGVSRLWVKHDAVQPALLMETVKPCN